MVSEPAHGDTGATLIADRSFGHENACSASQRREHPLYGRFRTTRFGPIVGVRFAEFLAMMDVAGGVVAVGWRAW
jgi:hypothetical protein